MEDAFVFLQMPLMTTQALLLFVLQTQLLRAYGATTNPLLLDGFNKLRGNIKSTNMNYLGLGSEALINQTITWTDQCDYAIPSFSKNPDIYGLSFGTRDNVSTPQQVLSFLKQQLDGYREFYNDSLGCVKEVLPRACLIYKGMTYAYYTAASIYYNYNNCDNYSKVTIAFEKKPKTFYAAPYELSPKAACQAGRIYIKESHLCYPYVKPTSASGPTVTPCPTTSSSKFAVQMWMILIAMFCQISHLL